MKTLLLIMSLLVPGAVMAEGVLTPAANPVVTGDYDYRNSVRFQYDFLTGATAQMFTLSGGSTTYPTATAGRVGLMTRDTSASGGTTASSYLDSSAGLLLPSETHAMKWVIKLTQSDTDTIVRVGSGIAITSNPPTSGIYFQKLAVDTNWYCVTNLAGTTTGTLIDSGVAISTADYTTFAYERTSTGVTFAINGVPVCGTLNANLPTGGINPFAAITNVAAASKTMTLDYFEFQVRGIAR